MAQTLQDCKTPEEIKEFFRKAGAKGGRKAAKLTTPAQRKAWGRKAAKLVTPAQQKAWGALGPVARRKKKKAAAA
jgi:hypothetical protein